MAYQKGGQAAVAFRELRTFLVDTRADTIVARVLIAQIYIYILQGDLHQADGPRLVFPLRKVEWLLQLLTE